MSSTPTSAEPAGVVEHFFRHESVKLVAVLTRAFGIHHMDLVEDKVQEAMLKAVRDWPHKGTPVNPAGWLYRVARNGVLDVLRREKVHQRALALAFQTEEAIETLTDEWIGDEQISDSLLRMMFVCCHPSLDRRSQLALTLKVLCGFSLAEVARGLLISTEAAKKRVQRAKQTLQNLQINIDLPSTAELENRVVVVRESLYLLFNEGYSSSSGYEPLRDDMCQEATRLCQLLCEHETLTSPETRALLSLMLAHGSRLRARVDAAGDTILLEDQDRSQWDHTMIQLAEQWLEHSKTLRPSRFHFEAAIALVHCRAPSTAATDWPLIVTYYDRLLSLVHSPLYVLNRAIAKGETGEVAAALSDLDSIRGLPELREYFLLDCAEGRLHQQASNRAAALAAYRRARGSARAPHEVKLIDKMIGRLTGTSTPTRK